MSHSSKNLQSPRRTLPSEEPFWRDFVPKLTPPWPGRTLDLTDTNPRSKEPLRLGFDSNGVPSVEGAFNLWTYRRIIDRSLFEPGRFAGDIPSNEESAKQWRSSGEAVGCLASFALKQNRTPHAIRADTQLMRDFQKFIREQGIETQWA